MGQKWVKMGSSKNDPRPFGVPKPKFSIKTEVLGGGGVQWQWQWQRLRLTAPPPPCASQLMLFF